MTARYAANLTNHNPDNYSKNASFVYSAKYTQAVLALLDPQPGERIVDLGCGTGELTRQIADAVGPEGSVVGIDSSKEMVSGPRLCDEWRAHQGLAGQSRCVRVRRTYTVSSGRYPDTSPHELGS